METNKYSAQTKTENRYSGESGRAYRKKHAVPSEAHQWIAADRARKLSNYIKPDDVVLEYGVGPGWNLELLKCRERLGYDLQFSLHDQAPKEINFIKDSKSLVDSGIDVVICHHVLEHTIHPAQVLFEIRRLLCATGRLLLFVPYEKERKFRTFNPQEPNHHLYSWNVQTLANLVRDVGFEVQSSSIGRYGYDRILSVLASRMRVGGSGFKLMKILALTLIPLLEVRMVAIKQ